MQNSWRASTGSPLLRNVQPNEARAILAKRKDLSLSRLSVNFLKSAIFSACISSLILLFCRIDIYNYRSVLVVKTATDIKKENEHKAAAKAKDI
jgi:hypothetical protein